MRLPLRAHSAPASIEATLQQHGAVLHTTAGAIAQLQHESQQLQCAVDLLLANTNQAARDSHRSVRQNNELLEERAGCCNCLRRCIRRGVAGNLRLACNCLACSLGPMLLVLLLWALRTTFHWVIKPLTVAAVLLAVCDLLATLVELEMLASVLHAHAAALETIGGFLWSRLRRNLLVLTGYQLESLRALLWDMAWFPFAWW